jgi:MFS family permease
MPARRIFYGWYIVAAICLITTTTSGLAFYNMSVLLAAFTAERGFPVALASSATATFFVGGGIGGVIAGRLVDRIDPRIVIATSAAMGALALASVGWLHEVWHLYAFHATLGFCQGSGGLVPVTTLVARWFNARRALAFSLASTGLSLGGMFVTPFVALAVERLGIAGAGPWMGLGYFLGIVPVTILVLRASPQALGLHADGVSEAQAAANRASGPANTFSEALRNSFFYAVSIAYLFLLGAQVGAIAHIYRLASTRDGVATAALTLATMASCSTIGRLVGGWVLLRVPVRSFALGLMLVQSMALAWLSIAEGRTEILAGAVLFGITIGNSLMMHPLLLADRFGTRDYGRIYSSSQFISVVGVAGCPALIGLLYEVTGGYTVPFLAVACGTLVGFAVLGLFAASRSPP